MDERIAIVTDTNSGIPAQEARSRGIHLIPMPVIVDGAIFFENETITQTEFFTRLRGGATVGTSQPAVGALMDCWDALLKRCEAVIYLPMSSGLSGSYQSAAMLAEDYGGRVYVVDNRRISVTLRQSALEARHMADSGKSAQEIAAYLQEDGQESSIYIAVNTLEYLKHSGRVTAAGAAIGTVLNIKPVLQIQGGKLDAYKKARGMRYAMQTMIDALKQDQSIRFAGKRLTVRAAYSGDPEAGALWRAELQKAFPEYEVGMDALPISIACHTGDGALGVGMMKDIFCEGNEVTGKCGRVL